MTDQLDRRWDVQWLTTLVLGALGAFSVVFLLTADLFVWTEARDMIGLPNWPGDFPRWLLFPELHYGPARLTGMASFQLTGKLCGADLGCVNGVGAAMLSAGTVLLLIHTRHITRSRVIAVAVAALWVLSPPVLGIAVWQSARFDSLVFIGVVATGVFWWESLGGDDSRGWQVATIVVSVLLMAFTFNAKEVGFLLVGMMPALAIVRGAGRPGAIRRNLVLTVIPLTYGIWFVAHALTHVEPIYAADASGAPMVPQVRQLLTEMFGVSRRFMFTNAQGETYESLNRLAKLGYLIFGIALLLAVVVAQRHGLLRRPLVRLRTQRWGRLTTQAAPWLYLAGMAVVIIAVSARSSGAGAYYLPLAYWAVLALGAMAVRWICGYVPRRRPVLIVLSVLYVVPALTAFASLLTDGTTYGRLVAASRQMAEAGRSCDRPSMNARWRRCHGACWTWARTRSSSPVAIREPTSPPLTSGPG